MKKMAGFACHAAIALVAIVPAAAQAATRTEFEGFIHFCSSSDADVFRVTPGGSVHFRGATNTNIWATNNPYVDGTETNEVVAANINRHGRGQLTLRVTLAPFAFDGTWEITQQLKIGDDGVFTHGVGHGTGELRGMTIKFAGPAGEGPGPNPCSDFGSAPVHGVILSP